MASPTHLVALVALGLDSWMRLKSIELALVGRA